MKNVYSPPRPDQAKDWSGNVMTERKVKLKKQRTVDEFGNGVLKLLRPAR